MARTLTTAFKNALASKVKYPITLVELTFDDGILRVWTGVGDITWNGHNWIGSGDFGTISVVEETAGLQSGSLRCELRGVRFENLALALNQVTQGAPCNFYFGLLDADGAVIASPVSMFAGPMGAPDIVADGESTMIGIEVQGPDNQLRDKRERRRTHEDQQIDYPGDMFFEHVPALQKKEVTWQ